MISSIFIVSNGEGAKGSVALETGDGHGSVLAVDEYVAPGFGVALGEPAHWVLSLGPLESLSKKIGA